MSSNTFQLDPSDILDERVDSSQILTDRLESWHHAVSIVLEYAQQEYAAQSQVSSHLSKQRKTVNQLPNFSGSSVTGGTQSQGPHASPSASGLTAPTGSANVGGIASAFRTLAQQNDVLLRESDYVAQSIKGSVIPPLESSYSDLEKHYKTLRSGSQRSVKEIEKSREATTKQLEALGKSVSTAGVGTQKPDPRNDPYNSHRRVRSVAAEQINSENQHAESNLNTQNNFGSLEQHTIEVIQNAVSQLDTLSNRYYSAGANSSRAISESFGSVQPSGEWSQFITTNKASLVPSQGFQRDPTRVTFANSDAPSTKPLMEGISNRKGTVLKGKKPGYYVLTPMGFLHEYKSADYVQDPQPELSLYIPESQSGGLQSASSGDLSFKISSKDANKLLGSRHKYTFIASSYDELSAWHQALSRVAGGTSASPDSLEGEEDEGDSVSSSPYGANAPAPVPANARTTDAVPATPATPATKDISSGAEAPVLAGATTTSATPAESFTRGVPTTATSQYQPSSNVNTSGNLGTASYAAPGVAAATATEAGLAGTSGAHGGHLSSEQPLNAGNEYQRNVSNSAQKFTSNEPRSSSYGQTLTTQPTHLDNAGGLSGATAAAAGLPGQKLAGSHEVSSTGNNLTSKANDFRSGNESYDSKGDNVRSHIPGSDKLESGKSVAEPFTGSDSKDKFSGASDDFLGSKSSQPQSKLDPGIPSKVGTANDNLTDKESGLGLTSETPTSHLQSKESGFKPSSSTSPYATGAGVAATAAGTGAPAYASSHSNSGETSTPGHNTTASHSGYTGSGARTESRDVNASPSTTYGGVSTATDGISRGGTTASTGSSAGNRKSNVPHYRISPSKQPTLQSDHVDGLGSGGSFGGLPVETDAETAAKETREHDAEHGILDRSGHYDWNKQDLPHSGCRHDPADGFQEANEHPRSAAHYEPLNAVVGENANTSERNISKPISAEPFAVVYPESSVREEISNEESKYGNADKFNNSRFKNDYYDGSKSKEVYSKDSDPSSNSSYPQDTNSKTVATSAYAPPVSVPVSRQEHGSSSKPANDSLNSVKAKDVEYSTPSETAVPAIAAGETNPSLGSTTEYSAPSAQKQTSGQSYNKSDQQVFRDAPTAEPSHNIKYSTTPDAGISEIAAGTVNPSLGSTTEYRAPTTQSNLNQARFDHNSASAAPRGNDIHYSAPTSAGAPAIATGTVDPSLGSTTEYRSPTANAGASNVENFHTPQQTSTAKFPSTHAATTGTSDSGSKSPSSQQYSSSGHHHSRSGSAFSGQDTGSRLDPLSSKYSGATGATGAGVAGAGATGAPGHNYDDGFKDAVDTKLDSSLNRSQRDASQIKDTTYKFGDNDNVYSQKKNAYASQDSTYPSSSGQTGGHNQTHQYGHAQQASPNTDGHASTHHGTKTGAAATGAGAVGAGAAGAGVAGSGAGQTHHSTYQNASSTHHQSGSEHSKPTNKEKQAENPAASSSDGPSYVSGLGNYTSKDYSEYAPSKGSSDTAALQGPPSGSGKAKASSSSSGHGKKIGAVSGGIGAVAGLAGAAGIPGANEVGQAAGSVGQIGSNGIGSAIKSKIPGLNEAGQAKQLFQGDASGVAKNHVPGANEASQLNNTAKDLKGGNAESKIADQGSKEADKASGGKVGSGKKIAKVFK